MSGIIENYNCDGLCCEFICNRRYTHYIKLCIYNNTIVLGFCKKHYDMFLSEMLRLGDLKYSGKLNEVIFSDQKKEEVL